MGTIPDSLEGAGGFTPPRTMRPAELGDNLAQLVWESLSDLITDGEAESLLQSLSIPLPDGVPDQRATGELLIFLMWAHTRGAQLAFLGRAPEELIKKGLDEFHRAVFEDLERNGTNPVQLPLFEQRLGARYAEYHVAARASDSELGTAALRHLANSDRAPSRLAKILTERAVTVAGPLRDYLEDVELVD